ncbi:MAG TPA: thioredoxin domain-containing protein, partial [Pyrinomonadaceae bacterium]|nr:thioredoxin domain-containing protein [Pyrinomonadaceae bacterium]
GDPTLPRYGTDPTQAPAWRNSSSTMIAEAWSNDLDLRRCIMKIVLAAIILTMASLPSVAQSQTKTVAEDCACESQALPATLAVVNGVTIGARDIEKTTGEQVRNLQKQVTEARKRELDLMINSKLLATEAKKRGITTAKLLDQEVVAKVKAPTQTEAQTFYDQNKARIKDDFDSVKDDILRYLLDERQRTEAKKFADGLRAAGNTVIKSPQQNTSERAQVLAVVNGENITSGDVEDSLKALIFDVQEQVYNLRKNELDLTINDTLLTQEAQKRKITTNALLDAEVKPKQVSEEQARTFYEENKERISGEFTQTKDSIISYLQQTELRLAERAFVERLRATASIQVFLKAPESPVFSISTKDQPSLGNDNAAVTIVAFTDYQCPSCASMHPALERVVKENGDKVRLVTRDFPLSQHAEAFKAAEAAEAAREQGKYWEYIAVLMRNQSSLGVEKLKSFATELGLDRARFDSALDSGKFAETVQRDVEDGMKLGLTGTPSLFINGRRVTAKTYEDQKASVDAALKSSTGAGR